MQPKDPWRPTQLSSKRNEETNTIMHRLYVVLVAGIIGSIATLPGQTNGISPFTDLLLGVLPLTRSQLSLAYLVGTVGSALLMPTVGNWYDRHGSRRMGTLAVFSLGLSVLAMSYADRAAEGLLRLLPGIAPALLATVVMSGAFFLVRFFGQGMLSMSSRTMVMKWFDHRRGMGNAFLGPLSALGLAYFPRVFDRMITALGWRLAWQSIGLFLVLCGTLFVVFSFRDPSREERQDLARLLEEKVEEKKKKPSVFSLGLHPKEPPSPPRDFTLGEARKTYSFWIFNMVNGFSSLVITGFTFHVVSIFAMAGLDRQEAIGIFLPATFFAVVVQGVGSLLSDYMRLRSFAMLHMLGVALLAFSCLYLRPGIPYILLVTGVGLNVAMMGINGVIVWPRFFGLGHLGSISGEAFLWVVGGSALGPYAFSLAASFWGSYGGALVLFGTLGTLLCILSWFAHNPNVARKNPTPGKS
jgi:MFS family permease